MSVAIRSGEGPRRLAAVLLAAVIAAWTQDAEACSVCLSATEATREAYYLTTVVMMLLPFVLLGALLYWLRRAAGRRDETGETSGWSVDRAASIQRGSPSE